MKIIAAYAQKENGKDTLCDYLLETLNQNVKEWKTNAFANPVKDIFCQAFGVDRAFIEKWKRIDEPPPGFLMPVRKILQMIGDGFRQAKSNIWLEIALRGEEKQVIVDGRYINEAKAVKDKGGMTILVYRKGYLNNDPNPSESQIVPCLKYCMENLKSGIINFDKLKNPPEDLKHFDIYIENDGTLEDLYAKARDIVLKYYDAHKC